MIGFRAQRIAVAVCVCGVLAASTIYSFYFAGSEERRFSRAWNRLSHRPTIGRLSGMSYRPPPNSQSTPSADRLLTMRGASLPALQSDTRENTARRATIVALLAGRASEAVRTMEQCAAADPAAVQCWADLSAARIELAREDDPFSLVAGLAAADRAIALDPRSETALFNRAMALEELRLARPAVLAWHSYLMVDAASEWALEARTRLAALEGPTRTVDWERARPNLATATERNDTDSVRAIVERFRQEARSRAEMFDLGDWARARQRDDPAVAASLLNQSRQIGRALEAINGERLLSDAVAAIDRADARRTADLVEAQISYFKARKQYTVRAVDEALPDFERAARLFDAAGSPMAHVARYYVANCRCDRGEIEACIAAIDRELGELPDSYQALRGQLLWERGFAASRSGRLWDALHAYTSALQTFDKLVEVNNAGYMRNAVAVVQATLGRDGDAWRNRLELFRAVSRAGDSRLLQSSITAAARSEAAAGRWDTAWSLYGLSLDPQLDGPNRSRRADARTWRALAAHRIGLSESAAEEISRARIILTAIPAGSVRNASAGRLAIAEASIVRDVDPRRAVDLLTRSIEDAQRSDVFYLAEALLERGRARRALGHEKEAISDLEASLAAGRSMTRDADERELRDSYFDVETSATEELIDLLDRRGDRQSLLAAVDRDPTSFAVGPADARAVVTDPFRLLVDHLPPRTILLHFTTLHDRLLIISVDHSGIDIHRVPITGARLKQKIAELDSAIRREDASTKRRGAELHDLVLGPLQERLSRAETVVVIADAVMAATPFPALIAHDGRFLVESHTVLHASSAAAYSATLDRPPRRVTRETRALAVGNPDFDRTASPELPPLPAAEAEAAEVGRRYAGALVLTRTDATRKRIVDAMQIYPVVDIACHTVMHPSDPARSWLLLAPSDGDAGALYLRDIAQMALTQTEIVVVAACRTAEPRERAAGALRSFAQAFVAAGARNALGTLWNVDDDAARFLSAAFHRHLTEGILPAEALRMAQLEMLRSGDTRLSTPRAWSAFQLIGAGN